MFPTFHFVFRVSFSQGSPLANTSAPRYPCAALRPDRVHHDTGGFSPQTLKGPRSLHLSKTGSPLLLRVRSKVPRSAEGRLNRAMSGSCRCDRWEQPGRTINGAPKHNNEHDGHSRAHGAWDWLGEYHRSLGFVFLSHLVAMSKHWVVPLPRYWFYT